MTSPAFCQQKQQPSYINITKHWKLKVLTQLSSFFLKRATKYLDIPHQDHNMDKEEDKHQTQKQTNKHQVFFFINTATKLF